MNWVESLQGLPVPISILVVFTFCLFLILRSVFKRVVDPMAQSNKETAETIRKGLDANTEAVKENADAVRQSVEHNETIITNHLSGQAKRDEAQMRREAVMLEEMKNVVVAISQSNERRRVDD